MAIKKRVVITGASGFVGANLARRLLKEGHMVHLLLRPGYKPWRIKAIRNDAHIHLVDLRDEERLSGVISRIRPEWVFHLAAYGAYSWQNDLSRMIETNVEGTASLVEACLKTGFEAFVNTGSSSEYGIKGHATSEAERLEPNSHYALTKAHATLLCSYAAKRHNMHICTLRLYSVYGPYEEPMRLVPNLILHGLKGGFPALVKPEVSHDFVYIEDVEKAYILAAVKSGKEKGAIYNVGTGIQVSLREVVNVVKWAMGIEVKPVWGSMPGRKWDTDIWISDNRKIRKELSWKPRYTFARGFKKTVAWFQDNPEQLLFYRKASSRVY